MQPHSYIPKQHKNFWKTRIFAAAYGNVDAIYFLKSIAPLMQWRISNVTITHEKIIAQFGQENRPTSRPIGTVNRVRVHGRTSKVQQIRATIDYVNQEIASRTGEMQKVCPYIDGIGPCCVRCGLEGCQVISGRNANNIQP